MLVRLARPLVFGPLWLLLRRRLPREPVVLSRRLWKLVLGLAAMPLCALIAVVLLTFRRYDSIEVNTVAMYPVSYTHLSRQRSVSPAVRIS